MPLQGANPTPSFGGFGLRSRTELAGCLSKKRLTSTFVRCRPLRSGNLFSGTGTCSRPISPYLRNRRLISDSVASSNLPSRSAASCFTSTNPLAAEACASAFPLQSTLAATKDKKKVVIARTPIVTLEAVDPHGSHFSTAGSANTNAVKTIELSVNTENKAIARRLYSSRSSACMETIISETRCRLSSCLRVPLPADMSGNSCPYCAQPSLHRAGSIGVLHAAGNPIKRGTDGRSAPTSPRSQVMVHLFRLSRDVFDG